MYRPGRAQGHGKRPPAPLYYHRYFTEPFLGSRQDCTTNKCSAWWENRSGNKQCLSVGLTRRYIRYKRSETISVGVRGADCHSSPGGCMPMQPDHTPRPCGNTPLFRHPARYLLPPTLPPSRPHSTQTSRPAARPCHSANHYQHH